jgi:hypothetical protein
MLVMLYSAIHANHRFASMIIETSSSVADVRTRSVKILENSWYLFVSLLLSVFILDEDNW